MPDPVGDVQCRVGEVAGHLIRPLEGNSGSRFGHNTSVLAWILIARSGGGSVSDWAIMPAPARYHAVDAVKEPGNP